LPTNLGENTDGKKEEERVEKRETGNEEEERETK